MRRTVGKVFLVLFFVLGTLQPLSSLTRILLYGGLFEYNFTYLRAANAELAGKSIYSFGDINYPPPALFLFIPFHFLPVFWGQIIWSVISLGCLVLALFFSFKALEIDWGWKNLILILPLTLLAFPTKWTLGLGQINNTILLLMVLGFFFHRRNKFVLSGLSLGVATSLKIVPGALLLYFLVKKEFKIFVSGMITMVALFLLSGFAFGFNLVGEYFSKVVPATLGIEGKYTYYNQAASGLFSRILGDGERAVVATMIFSFLVLLVTLFILRRQKKVDAFGYSLIISSTLLINSFSWQHHFIWLLFPFLTIFACLKKHPNRKLQVLVLVAYLLVAFNIKEPGLLMGNFFGKILLSHVFLGNFLLWLLLVFLISRKSEKILH